MDRLTTSTTRSYAQEAVSRAQQLVDSYPQTDSLAWHVEAASVGDFTTILALMISEDRRRDTVLPTPFSQ